MNTRELPSIWLAVGEDGSGEVVRCIFSAHYSASGLTTTVRRQHSGEVVGKAQGGGYDKTSTALAKGLSKVFNIPTTDGGYGEGHVVEHAFNFGVRVVRLSEALFMLDVL
jgi:hypothetical protein